MLKNVRSTIALSFALSFIIFTGIEVVYNKRVSDNFYTVVSMIATAYFVTRAKEDGGGKNGSL